MCQFFCADIIQHCRSHAVWHGKPLRQVPHGCPNLTIRATGVQYPIIAPQAQRLCGFAGFLVREKYYKYVKKAEMTLFMDG